VFEIFGCETLAVLEATHVVPVSCGGGESWNCIPLRADLHRLFDAGIITIYAKNWTISVVKTARKNYGAYRGNDLSAHILKTEGNSKFPMVLKKRMSVTS
jgi:hypothetical protein